MAQNVGLRTFASVTNLLFELTREIRLMIFVTGQLEARFVKKYVSRFSSDLSKDR